MSSRLWNMSSNKREAKTGCRMKSSTTPWEWEAVSEPVPEPASAFLSVPEPVPNFWPRTITCTCSWNQPLRVGSQVCPCGSLCCGAAAASLAQEQLNRGAVERSGPGSPLTHQSGFEVEPAPGMDDVAPAEVDFTLGRPEEGSLYVETSRAQGGSAALILFCILIYNIVGGQFLSVLHCSNLITEWVLCEWVFWVKYSSVNWLKQC